MDKERIIVLGAGITGLSAAWYLEKAGYKDITIIEASGRAGGKVQTLYEDGFIIEQGADSFITLKPFAMDLVEELGLSNELIAPLTSSFFILKDNKLQKVPEGLRMMVPVNKDAFMATAMFSEAGKQRVFEEVNIPPLLSDEDESFASFITRRFGKEMLDNYAQPLFGGIYATPAEQLSMKACFPQWLAMEQKYGSITKAVEEQPAPRENMSRSAFLSLKNGIQSLIDKLRASLTHTQFILNTKVDDIELNHDNTYIIRCGADTYHADRVISALPAKVIASLLEKQAAKVSAQLDSFTTSSSIIVTLAVKESQLTAPVSATGYVIANSENSPVTAGTWSSAKWAGRAPEGYALLRCFFGGGRSYTDAELIELSTNELNKLIGLQGQAEKSWINRYANALPQYKLGHLDRLATLRKSLQSLPGFHLAGAFLEGVGIPDCIRQGKLAAESIAGIGHN
jgi:oxygen-dependent protoporphyrinogen oxidase